jgi:CHAT domain-containing protein
VIGMAQRQLGDADAARQSFTTAVSVVEGLRRQVAGPQFARERYFETRLSPYHELIELAMSTDAPEQALEIGERAKARALADLLHLGRVRIARTMDDADKREDRRLRASLLALNQQLHAEQLEAVPDAQRIDGLERERDARRREYEGFQTALYAKRPDSAVVPEAAAPFRVADAASLAPGPSSAILVYILTGRSGYLYVVTSPGGTPKLDSFRLKADGPALTRMAVSLRERLARRDLAFADEARRAYELLVQPARRVLEGRSELVVVPDGALWDVPFQALIDERGDYLIESASVSYAPSLAVLAESMRRSSGRNRQRTLLAMGKSEFGAKGNPPAVPLMSDLSPLPDAERQVRLIRAMYGAERSTVYVGREAREDRFKADAPRHSIVHLATHGVLDESSPLYSHLVLSPGAEGSAEDGLLEAWELLDLDLDADLVILAACETGRGRIASGEGIVGTMWALFAAGAQATIASQWKVEASSTTRLMTGLHRHLAAGNGSKADALRAATLDVLRDARYAHPFYWAPFVLVGNPR